MPKLKKIIILVFIIMFILVIKTIFFTLDTFKVLKTYSDSIKGCKLLKLDNKDDISHVFKASEENDIPYWYGIKYDVNLNQYKWSDNTHITDLEYSTIDNLVKKCNIEFDNEKYKELLEKHTPKELSDKGLCLKIFDNKIWATSCLDKAYVIYNENSVCNEMIQQLKKK